MASNSNSYNKFKFNNLNVYIFFHNYTIQQRMWPMYRLKIWNQYPLIRFVYSLYLFFLLFRQKKWLHDLWDNNVIFQHNQSTNFRPMFYIEPKNIIEIACQTHYLLFFYFAWFNNLVSNITLF